MKHILFLLLVAFTSPLVAADKVNVLFLSSAAPDREHVIHLLSASGHQPVVVDTAAQAGARAQRGDQMRTS